MADKKQYASASPSIRLSEEDQARIAKIAEEWNRFSKCPWSGRSWTRNSVLIELSKRENKRLNRKKPLEEVVE